MSRIIPLPTSRTTDVLTRSRLLSQIQQDQRRLLELQTQISSGRKLVNPSDDATASVRAIQLQRLLERKQQSAVSLGGSRTFLSATETAASSVADVLVSIRGEVIGAIGTTATDDQRDAVANQVRRAVDSLASIGNQRFRGRHLFAGAVTDVEPFSFVDGYVNYGGNRNDLPSFADIGFQYFSNVTGHDAFGAISGAVHGRADLNPFVTERTRLDDLHGGLGVGRGSFSVSDGSSSSVIDVSGAQTLGEVIDLIENNPPDGRTLIARVTHNGLSLELDSQGGGNLNITEVAGGRTAFDLGIFEPLGVGNSTLIGKDVDPRLSLTTRLDDILGTPASAVFASVGANNDLVIEAKQNGAVFNDITIQLIDSGVVTKGNETVVYDDSDPHHKTLTFDVDAGNTNTNDLIDAFQLNPTVNALFSIRLYKRDTGLATDAGTGLVDVNSLAMTTGGSGVDFDRTAGLRIVNKDKTYVVDFAAAETIEDVLNAVEVSGANVLATMNVAGTGIDILSSISGADFHIGENGGATATQLGIRSLDRDTPLSDLNYGIGVLADSGTDFFIHRRDGFDLAIDISEAQTVGDVLDIINGHVDNQDPATQVVAQLKSFGNGIELTDSNATGADTLTVTRNLPNISVWQLGLIPVGMDQNVADSGTPGVLSGTDRNPIETHGAFNTLVRLDEALRNNNVREIERLVGELDSDLNRINFTRAEIGAREQTLDVVATRLSQEDIELQRVLSNEIDVDLVEAISQFTARQAAFQASLQAVAHTVRLSLLDFL
ncbi:MAG: hypothetical protein MK179_05010 [Pirellulaceae bacterium]|nr:hypothetical protein [Pirellulaceae bacterium]